jgi:hypothetical protein
MRSAVTGASERLRIVRVAGGFDVIYRIEHHIFALATQSALGELILQLAVSGTYCPQF